MRKALHLSGHFSYFINGMGFCFDVFLTVRHSVDLFHLPTLMHNSFIHEQYVCYITVLYMLRASTCLSSGGQIVYYHGIWYRHSL
jgi:hypothetical protein